MPTNPLIAAKSIFEKMMYIFSTLTESIDESEKSRIVAIRWFNRLYYDLYSWNESLIELFNNYPPRQGIIDEDRIYFFLDKLDEFRGGVSYTRNEDDFEQYAVRKFCSNMIFLERRFNEEFGRLASKDPERFDEVREIIGIARATRRSLVGLTANIVYFIIDVECGNNYMYNREEIIKWHMGEYNNIINAMNNYEKGSREYLNKIYALAEEAGVRLLDVPEYEQALYADGSIRTDVIVIGEIAMGDTYNNYGQVGAMGRGASSSSLELEMANDFGFRREDIAREIGVLKKQVIEELIENGAPDFRISKYKEDLSSAADEIENEGKYWRLIELTKHSGKRLLDASEKIGTSILTEIIKRML